jgi:hypothetical protein
VLALMLSACSNASTPPSPTLSPPVTAPITAPLPPAPSVTESPAVIVQEIGTYRPDWLGQLIIVAGESQDTPLELQNRRFPPPPGTPLAPSDTFTSTISTVPPDVAARSTWREECPVTLEDLRYLEMTFWGFDDQSYMGEMIVHKDFASDMVVVFEKLYNAKFPIEEMAVLSQEEQDADPAGDENNTSSFECRRVVGTKNTWSQHAYGKAIDINPFHNPYLKGDWLQPELSNAYLDRDNRRAGMIHSGDVVVEAFADIGWGWGGDWTKLYDWQHFSWNSK